MLLPQLTADAQDYYAEMAARGRLLTIQQEGFLWGLCTYYLVDEVDEASRYLSRDMYSTPADSPHGIWAYIDQLGGLQWSRETLRQVRAVLLETHPQLVGAIWHRQTRGGGWRRYTLGREGGFYGTSVSG